MGGSQSVRKITIDNNNADVIKVSQSVVERLKSGSKTEVSRNTEEKVSEEPRANVRPPNITPTYSNNAQPMYVYPSGAIPIQEEIQKEVEKTNEYWRHRISKLETSQAVLSNRMQQEYDKTMKEFEKLLPELEAKKGKKLGDVSDLNQVKERLIKCYKENKNKSLNCAAEVENFNRCFEEKRVALQKQRS